MCIYDVASSRFLGRLEFPRQAEWSTLIGRDCRGFSLIGLLCHKEPARSKQNTHIAILDATSWFFMA